MVRRDPGSTAPDAQAVIVFNAIDKPNKIYIWFAYCHQLMIESSTVDVKELSLVYRKYILEIP